LKRRAIIVDDESDARARLRRLLAGHADEIEIVGEAADGISAVSAIGSLSPDLGFLDIEMPGLNGFQLLDSLPRELATHRFHDRLRPVRDSGVRGACLRLR
jgi:YesN/AraC family two-component response regulator